jgi:DNA repair ATPase RecN
MKIKFIFKAQDDAISETGQILSNFSRFLDKVLNEVTKLSQLEDRTPEYDISLSENSPYRNIDEDNIFNEEMINQVKSEIVTFMYFPDELEAFENEYKELINNIQNYKNNAIKSLENTKGILETMPKDRREAEENKQAEDKVKTIKEALVNYIKKVYQRLGKTIPSDVQNLPLFKPQAKIDELISSIDTIIQQLSI